MSRRQLDHPELGVVFSHDVRVSTPNGGKTSPTYKYKGSQPIEKNAILLYFYIFLLP
jgi:hypothetical protein